MPEKLKVVVDGAQEIMDHMEDEKNQKEMKEEFDKKMGDGPLSVEVKALEDMVEKASDMVDNMKDVAKDVGRDVMEMVQQMKDGPDDDKKMDDKTPRPDDKKMDDGPRSDDKKMDDGKATDAPKSDEAKFDTK